MEVEGAKATSLACEGLRSKEGLWEPDPKGEAEE